MSVVACSHIGPLNTLAVNCCGVSQTVDFSDLTDGDKAVFKSHDVINPQPRVGRDRVASERAPLLTTPSKDDVEVKTLPPPESSRSMTGAC